MIAVSIRCGIAVVLALGLGACAAEPSMGGEPVAVAPAPIPVGSKRLVAVGYGSPAPYTNMTYAQQKLMAIRAAQVDAYRNLAEQIKGVGLTSSTTISAFSGQSDTIRAQVEALVKGARVINVSSANDGNWEVKLEVDVPDNY